MRHGQQRGGIFGAIFGTLAIIFVCGLILLAGAAWVISSRVRVTESARGETRVETPVGNLTVRERTRLDPALLGVPVYPGAVRLVDSRKLASFDLDFGNIHKDLTFAVAEYETPDPLSAVEAFYRDKLDGARVKKGRGHRDRLVLEVEGGSVKKIVALRERSGGTHISLASVTDAAAN